jgi:hypothetical protein
VNQGLQIGGTGLQLGLRQLPNPRMYGVLTAITPGCVAFSLPVQRRNRPFLDDSSVLPAFPEPARTARPQGRPVPEHRRRPIPGTYATRDGFERRYGHNRTRRGPTDFRRALRRRKDGHQRPTGGPPPPDMFQTGRRLMRQTVLPSQFCGPSAPMRSDSSTRRCPLRLRLARRLGLRFGLPLTPESGGPSRHRPAQFAPPAKRVRRLQEFKNAEQNADRCHPPGGDPGCRGPWQSRRRV